MKMPVVPGCHPPMAAPAILHTSSWQPRLGSSWLPRDRKRWTNDLLHTILILCQIWRGKRDRNQVTQHSRARRMISTCWCTIATRQS